MPKRKQTDTVDLKVRMKEPLRASLERAAKRRGVSMNAEAVNRLEQSFEIEDRFGGPRMVELMESVARIMKQTGEIAGHYESGKSAKRGQWLGMPYAFDQAISAANVALESFRPPGEPVVPESTIDRLAAIDEAQLQLPPAVRELFAKLGTLTAAHEIQKKDEDNE